MKKQIITTLALPALTMLGAVAQERTTVDVDNSPSELIESNREIDLRGDADVFDDGRESLSRNDPRHQDRPLELNNRERKVPPTRQERDLTEDPLDDASEVGKRPLNITTEEADPEVKADAPALNPRNTDTGVDLDAGYNTTGKTNIDTRSEVDELIDAGTVVEPPVSTSESRADALQEERTIEETRPVGAAGGAAERSGNILEGAVKTVGEALKGGVNTAGEVVEGTVETGGEVVKGGARTTRAAVSDDRDTGAALRKSGRNISGETVETGREISGAAIDTGRNTVGEATDAPRRNRPMREAGETTGESVEGAAETTGRTVEGAARTTGQAAEGAARTTGQAAEGAARTTGQAAEGAARTTGQAAEGAARTTGQAAEGAARTTSQAAEGAVETGGNVLRGAGRAVKNAVEGIGEAVTGAAGRANADNDAEVTTEAEVAREQN